MNRFLVLATASAALLSLASTSFGQSTIRDPADDLRTAEQAKAMLAKAVAAVKADKVKALDMFNKDEGGFRDGNLYVTCVNIGDGKFVATGNPNLKRLLGTDARTFKDEHGSPLFLEEVKKKAEGEITGIDVEIPKPETDKTPVPKELYATKVTDLICWVGYYYWDNTRKPKDLN